MLQVAVENEVQDFLSAHSNRIDDKGRRQVVRDGLLTTESCRVPLKSNSQITQLLTFEIPILLHLHLFFLVRNP